MRRVLIAILILAVTPMASARDKKAKVRPGPYVFTSKAAAQTVRNLIVQASLKDGFVLDSDHELEFRFSRPAQMPLYGALFMASSGCPGMTTKQVWSYTLEELKSKSTTKVTVQPAWEYPDDYCQTQTHSVAWSQPEEIAAFQAMLDKAPAQIAAAQVAAVQVAPAAVAEPSASIAQANAPVSTPKAAAQDDSARRIKQHQACLDLAKDNPTITCK